MSFDAIAQETNRNNIHELEDISARLAAEIKTKSDSLNLINEEIKHYQNQIYLAKFKLKGDELIMPAKIKMEGKLRKSNSPLSDIITIISINDTVNLTDYQLGYWIANKNQFFGYLSEIYVDETEEIKIFKEELIKLNNEFRIRKEKEETERRRLEIKEESAIQKEKEREYRQKIYNQYGKDIGQKLLDGYYWIGMTSKMALVSLGEPRSINKSVGKWGTHEQWVYYATYLYFENGILTSYQNSK
jgi:hypothetical protein